MSDTLEDRLHKSAELSGVNHLISCPLFGEGGRGDELGEVITDNRNSFAKKNMLPAPGKKITL